MLGCRFGYTAFVSKRAGASGRRTLHYAAARKRALAALRSARSLGTRGEATRSRDELHER
jgi:hypothetical protein